MLFYPTVKKSSPYKIVDKILDSGYNWSLRGSSSREFNLRPFDVQNNVLFVTVVQVCANGGGICIFC